MFYICRVFTTKMKNKNIQNQFLFVVSKLNFTFAKLKHPKFASAEFMLFQV